jgi:hypothetical protein
MARNPPLPKTAILARWARFHSGSYSSASLRSLQQLAREVALNLFDGGPVLGIA